MLKEQLKIVKDSLKIAFGIVGAISTLCTIIGFSLKDILILDGISGILGIFIRSILAIVIFAVLSGSVYIIAAIRYKHSIHLRINSNKIEICHLDLFKSQGLRVIGMDTHFDTRVDNIVISQKSLHGEFLVNHCNISELKEIIRAEANRLGIDNNENGQYTFPLGTVVRYTNSKENITYLLVALSELNETFESHTSMAQYEQMLMHMWKNINRLYNGYNVVLPLLGMGVTRFDDGPKNPADLLRCILCTLNASKVQFSSRIQIVLLNNTTISLYQYKNFITG